MPRTVGSRSFDPSLVASIRVRSKAVGPDRRRRIRCARARAADRVGRPIRPNAQAAASRTTGSRRRVGRQRRDGAPSAPASEDQGGVADQARSLRPRQGRPLEGGPELDRVAVEPGDQVGVDPLPRGRAVAPCLEAPCDSRGKHPGRYRNRTPSRRAGRPSRRGSALCARSSSSSGTAAHRAGTGRPARRSGRRRGSACRSRSSRSRAAHRRSARHRRGPNRGR